jgi:hypothetical protein
VTAQLARGDRIELRARWHYSPADRERLGLDETSWVGATAIWCDRGTWVFDLDHARHYPVDMKDLERVEVRKLVRIALEAEGHMWRRAAPTSHADAADYEDDDP